MPPSPTRWAVLALPAVVVVAVVVLGLLRVSGSSIGLYGTDYGAGEDESGVLVGPPRPIRSDEWLVRTPWVFRQVERDFADSVPGALGRHDADLLYDLPTRGWEVVLRPQTAVYRVLGAEQAFAVEWWSLSALQLLGVYALLVTLTGRPALSALGASLLTFSPATQWWTTPATFTTVGWGCLATACALRAFRSGNGRRRTSWAVAAGAALASFLAALYPPWQIAVALVLVPLAAGVLLSGVRAAADRRAALRSLALTGVVTAAVAVAMFGPFVVGHGDAIADLSETVYPGHREASEGGGTSVAVAFGSAFDSLASDRPYRVANGTNQSENSSTLPFLLPAGAAAGALAARRRWTGSALAAPLAGCLAGGALLTAWMLLPLPAAMGKGLLLSRVPGFRLPLPVGLAGVLALTLVAAHLSRENRVPWWGVAGGASLFGAASWWAATDYTVDEKSIDLGVAALLAAVATTGVALALSRRPAAGLAVLAGFTVWQASLINPLQQGVEPLTENALRHKVDELRRQSPADAGWIVFSADQTVRGTITAAGVNNLAGVSPYPDRVAWRVLDPEEEAERYWNRYAHIAFEPGPPGETPAFRLAGQDDLRVTLDPCSPALVRLGVRFVVTQGFELQGCGQALARIPHRETYLMVYRR